MYIRFSTSKEVKAMSDILNLTNEAASLRSSVQISKEFKATDIIVDNHFRLIIHRNEIPV